MKYNCFIKKIMKELNKFILETEEFQNKNILFLKIDNRGIKEKKIYINKNDNFFCSNLIYSYINNFTEDNLDEIESLKNTNYSFEYIIITLDSFKLNKKHVRTIFKKIKKCTKKGFRVFVCWNNEQNIFSKLIKLSRKNKKRNLTFSDEFLLYDYKYHNRYELNKSKRHCFRRIYFSIMSFYEFLIDMNRFTFMSSHVLVKYIYIPKLKEI